MQSGNKLKKLCAIFLVTTLLFALAGCAKCISIEYEKVNMTIVKVNYVPASTLPVRIGKVWTYSVKPAMYRTTVEYDGIRRTFSDKHTYDKYKNMVGLTVIGTLEIAAYDDGTIERSIISLGG